MVCHAVDGEKNASFSTRVTCELTCNGVITPPRSGRTGWLLLHTDLASTGPSTTQRPGSGNLAKGRYALAIERRKDCPANRISDRYADGSSHLSRPLHDRAESLGSPANTAHPTGSALRHALQAFP